MLDQANPHVHQQHIVQATTFRSGLPQPFDLIKAGATQTETSLLQQYAVGERVDLLDDYDFPARTITETTCFLFVCLFFLQGKAQQTKVGLLTGDRMKLKWETYSPHALEVKKYKILSQFTDILAGFHFDPVDQWHTDRAVRLLPANLYS